MSRSFFLVMATAASLPVWPDAASGCSCIARPISASEHRQWLDGFSGVVFRGTVMSGPERPGIGTNPFALAQYTFKVERVWKGVTTSELAIESLADEGACGITFVRGRTYLIAATPPDRPVVNVCTPGWLHTSNEAAFVAAVGQGSPPP